MNLALRIQGWISTAGKSAASERGHGQKQMLEAAKTALQIQRAKVLVLIRELSLPGLRTQSKQLHTARKRAVFEFGKSTGDFDSTVELSSTSFAVLRDDHSNWLRQVDRAYD